MVMRMKPHNLWFDWHKGVTVSHEQKLLTWFTKHLQTHRPSHLCLQKRERNNIKLCTHTFSQAITNTAIPTPVEVSDIHMS